MRKKSYLFENDLGEVIRRSVDRLPSDLRFYWDTHPNFARKVIEEFGKGIIHIKPPVDDYVYEFIKSCIEETRRRPERVNSGQQEFAFARQHDINRHSFRLLTKKPNFSSLLNKSIGKESIYDLFRYWIQKFLDEGKSDEELDEIMLGWMEGIEKKLRQKDLSDVYTIDEGERDDDNRRIPPNIDFRDNYNPRDDYFRNPRQPPTKEDWGGLIGGVREDSGEIRGGEFWIDEMGSSEFADGDIGDANHVMIVRQTILSNSALNLDWDSAKDAELIDAIMGGNKSRKWLKRVAKLSDEAIDALLDDDDARFYGIKNLGWYRVIGKDVETWELTKNDLESIASGLYDCYGEINPDEHFNIEVKKTGEYFTGIPFWVIEEGDMAKVHQAVRGGIFAGLCLVERLEKFGAYKLADRVLLKVSQQLNDGRDRLFAMLEDLKTKGRISEIDYMEWRERIRMMAPGDFGTMMDDLLDLSRGIDTGRERDFRIRLEEIERETLREFIDDIEDPNIDQEIEERVDEFLQTVTHSNLRNKLAEVQTLLNEKLHRRLDDDSEDADREWSYAAVIRSILKKAVERL